MINPFKKQYWVSVTGEWWRGVRVEYQDWHIGRVEVYDDNKCFSIDEYRYLFPSELKLSFQKFMEPYEITNVNWFQLQYIKLVIKYKYNKI